MATHVWSSARSHRSQVASIGLGAGVVAVFALAASCSVTANATAARQAAVRHDPVLGLRPPSSIDDGSFEKGAGRTTFGGPATIGGAVGRAFQVDQPPGAAWAAILAFYLRRVPELGWVLEAPVDCVFDSQKNLSQFTVQYLRQEEGFVARLVVLAVGVPNAGRDNLQVSIQVPAPGHAPTQWPETVPQRPSQPGDCGSRALNGTL